MQIVIPMSGAGERFARAGYRDPKPLIEVDGAPMIEHVVRMFPGEHEFVFVCARPHLEGTPLRRVLARVAPRGRIVAIAPHKLGPVHAVLQAAEAVRDDAPVIVNYCDFLALWPYTDFAHRVAASGCEGALTAYRGFHPHSLGPTRYAYMREQEGRLLEIQEKQAFTDDPLGEYASTGTYYFRSGELLKRYFKRAVAEGLRTGGEYYASMPYNLMVRDGLSVEVHEVERFFQWGTPEDLEEYQAWSRYFARRLAPPASLPGSALIPMAGTGERFRREDYATPKPFVDVAGTPMLERTLASLPRTPRTVVLCRPEHLARPELPRILDARGASRIVTVGDTRGQASTCLLARVEVPPDEPLLVASCDASWEADGGGLLALISDPSVDGVVFTFRDHAHARRHPEQYGWVRPGDGGTVQGVLCKAPPEGDVRAAHGIVGAFWFRRARDLFDAINTMIADDRRVSGEFYVDVALEYLLASGHRVHFLDVDSYVSFGTPDDVRTFAYWEACLRAAPHHPYGKEAR